MVNIDPRRYVTRPSAEKPATRVEPVKRTKVAKKSDGSPPNQDVLDEYPKERRQQEDRRQSLKPRDDVYDMRNNNGRRRDDPGYPHIEVDV